MVFGDNLKPALAKTRKVHSTVKIIASLGKASEKKYGIIWEFYPT